MRRERVGGDRIPAPEKRQNAHRLGTQHPKTNQSGWTRQKKNGPPPVFPSEGGAQKGQLGSKSVPERNSSLACVCVYRSMQYAGSPHPGLEFKWQVEKGVWEGDNDDDDRLGSRACKLNNEWKRERREERECTKQEAIGGKRNSVSRGGKEEWRRRKRDRPPECCKSARPSRKVKLAWLGDRSWAGYGDRLAPRMSKLWALDMSYG